MRFKDAVSYNKYEAETGKRVIKDLMVHFNVIRVTYIKNQQNTYTNWYSQNEES